MNYSLFQLQFNTSVHFGSSDSALSLYRSEDHFRADTLFSALCHTALQTEGSEGLERLLNLARSGTLLLSDSMPWGGETYYLPKPMFSPETAPELPAGKRKALKKLAWIPVMEFDHYCNALKTGEVFEGDAVHFGVPFEATKARVSVQKDTLPYPVGLYRFEADCGLYFLLGSESFQALDWLSSLIGALGVSGIGGKISSGYGKFTVCDEILLNEFFDEQTEWIYTALSQPAKRSMLLTTCLPTDEELDTALDGAFYQLIRRGGFVASDTYADSFRKKQAQYYLSAGSVLNNRFAGELYQVGTQGSHPVYRYAKPIFLGVSL